MRIAFLTYENPSAENTGDSQYTAGLLRKLIEHGHHVHLVFFSEDLPADSAVDLDKYASATTIVPFARPSMLRVVASLKPGMIAHRFSTDYIDAVRALLEHESFDAVVVNSFKMSYLIDTIKSAAPSVPAVSISHNAEKLNSDSLYRHQTNPVWWLGCFQDWVKTAYYEPILLKRFDAVTTICSVDQVFYEKEYDLPCVSVVPAGWDASRDFAVDREEVLPNVIVCGSFTWQPKKQNLLSLLNCPRFTRFHEHGITVYLVGHADKGFVEFVNSRYPGVVMTGTVDDVSPFYRKCSVALVPERMGGGFKLKLLEAAAYGTGIVAVKGAVTDDGFQRGVHYLEADNYEDLVDTAIELVDHGEQLKSLRTNARALLVSRYTWEFGYRALMAAIDDART
jgi:glycosyltransferase involved in cell wall biosynthesis